jgi:hypothetical protein
LGGASSLQNAQILCGHHHKQKTKLDAKIMAKADRMGGRSGQFARRKKNGSKIQSRGFQKPPDGFKHSWPSQSLNRRKKT